MQQGEKIDWDKVGAVAAPVAPSSSPAGIDWDRVAKVGAPEPSITDKVRAFAASVGGAAYQSTGQAMEFTGRNLGLESLEAGGQALAQRGTENLAAAETVNPGGFGNEVGEIIGGGLPMAALGLATGGASVMAGAGLRTAAAMGSAAVSLFGGAQNAQAGREEAIQYGRPDQAGKSEALSFLIGLSEGLPVWGVIGKAVKAGGMNPDKIAGLLIRAIVENAAQEGGQQLLENPKAKMLYDERRAFTQGVLEATKRGAIGGAIFGGGGLAAGKAAEALSGGGAPTDKGKEADPGSVQPALSQEPAAEPVKREALEAVSPETETGIKAFSEQTGAKLRAVKPSTPEDTFLTEFGQQRGTRVTLVEAGDGKPMRLPAMYRDGEVLLDAAAEPGVNRRAVLYHELLHGLKDRQGESWDTLYADVQQIDPAGLQQAEQAYAEQFEQATGKPLPDILKPEEGLSRRAETLGTWLDAAINEPERLARALDKSRTFRERLRDTIARILEAVGVRFDSVQQQRLKELVRDLGKPPTGNAQQSLELAHKFAQAINSMAGIELVPRTESPQPQRATKSAEVKGTATASTEAGQAAATLPRAARERGKLGAPEKPPARDDRTAKALVELADKPAAELATMLAANEASETATEQRVLSGLGWEPARIKQYHDLRAKARNRKGLEAKSAARQLANLREQLQPEAVAELMAAPTETGHYTEDILRAAETRTLIGSEDAKVRADAVTPNKKDKPKVAEHKKGLRRQIKEGTDALGTDARFAVAPRTDTPEFKRWFGDSKVVDESGKPLVVYHGTGSLGEEPGETLTRFDGYDGKFDHPRWLSQIGDWFTADPEVADHFAQSKEDSQIIPVYISMQRPYRVDTYEDLESEIEESEGTVQEFAASLKMRQYDGIIILSATTDTGTTRTDYVSFDGGSQIKSAAGNSGAFDPANPDIRFAVAPAQEGEAAAKGSHIGERGPLDRPNVTDTLWDQIKVKFKDRLNRPRKIGKARGVEAAWADLVERMPARVAEQLRRLEARAVKPIRAALDRYGIELWEAGRYAYALHAPDANALAAKRSPRKFGKESNPGSGMSNSEAARIVAAVEADAKRLAGFKEIAGILRGVSNEKLAALVESGQITQKLADQWRNQLGPHYVSLKDSVVLPDFDRTNFGLGDNYAVTKARKGRMSKASYAEIIPQTLKLAGDAIVAGQTNMAANDVADWVKALNDPTIAEVITEEKADENDVIETVSPARPPAVKKGETLFSYRVGGIRSYIVMRDRKLAKAIQSLEPENIHDILRAANNVVAFLRHTRTNWTLEFPISNFQSDVGGAIVTIQREEGKGLGRSILRELGPALKTAWNAEHETGRPIDPMWKDFREDGAAPMYAEGRDSISMLRKLEKSFDYGAARQSFENVKDWVDHTNGAMELSTRFAIYKTMRRKIKARLMSEGMAADAADAKARSAAARIAQETTTPFMRKGEWSTGFGMLYLFFNARIQGTAILVNSLKSARVRNAVGAMMGLMFLSAIANRAMMGEDEDGEDEWDKIDRREKYMNFLMSIPGTKRVAKVRAPRMAQAFNTAAVGMAEMLFGDLKAGQLAADILTAAIDGFQPLDMSSSVAAAITPTVLQPVFQPITNQGPFGRRINPDYPNDKRPPSEQAFPSEQGWAKQIASTINELSGGDKITAGKVSLKPGSIKNTVDFITGGTGQLFSRGGGMVEKWINGQDIEPNDVPVFRKLIAGQSPRHEASRFYGTVKEVETVVDRVEGYRKAGEPQKAAQVREDNPELWRLRLQAKARSKRVAELRKLLDSKEPDDPMYAKIEAQIEQIMADFNDLARKAK